MDFVSFKRQKGGIAVNTSVNDVPSDESRVNATASAGSNGLVRQAPDRKSALLLSLELSHEPDAKRNEDGFVVVGVYDIPSSAHQTAARARKQFGALYEVKGKKNKKTGLGEVLARPRKGIK